MGSGKRLTDYEKGQIDAFRSKGDGYRKIGKALKRSVSAISNYVNGKTGRTKSSGRPKKLTMQQEVRIIEMASNSTKSLSTIKKQLKLNVDKKNNLECAQAKKVHFSTKDAKSSKHDRQSQSPMTLGMDSAFRRSKITSIQCRTECSKSLIATEKPQIINCCHLLLIRVVE